MCTYEYVSNRFDHPSTNRLRLISKSPQSVDKTPGSTVIILELRYHGIPSIPVLEQGKSNFTFFFSLCRHWRGVWRHSHSGLPDVLGPSHQPDVGRQSDTVAVWNQLRVNAPPTHLLLGSNWIACLSVTGNIQLFIF